MAREPLNEPHGLSPPLVTLSLSPLGPFKSSRLSGMIRNFFVLSPRGDTILAKLYRNDKNEGAHERSHTEALFRKIKFWDDLSKTKGEDESENNEVATDAENGGGTDGNSQPNGGSSDNQPTKKRTGDAPPVLMMPDGYTYFYIKRNGLIFGASTARNVSPNTVLEVSREQAQGEGANGRVSLFLNNDSCHSSHSFPCLIHFDSSSPPLLAYSKTTAERCRKKLSERTLSSATSCWTK